MRVGTILLAFALVVPSVPALAQETRPEEPTDSQQRQESRAAFRRGVGALEKQRWSVARQAFLEAYKLFPHPSILLDLGIARSHVGEVVEAEQDLTRFLADDTTATPEELQTARTTLAEVRNHVATLRVRVAPPGATATLDGKPIALVAGDFLSLRLSRGSHALEASAPGHESWSGRVDTDSPETKVVDLTLAVHEEAPVHAGLGTARIASITCFAVALATVGFASFAGVYSIDLANQYNTMGQPNYQNPSTKSTGIAFRTAADVTFVVAGALVAAGVVLWVTAPKRQPRVGLTPLGLVGRF